MFNVLKQPKVFQQRTFAWRCFFCLRLVFFDARVVLWRFVGLDVALGFLMKAAEGVVLTEVAATRTQLS